MKIICAGMSKTGTKTLNAALTTLGYKVYDVLENFEILGDQWDEIFQRDGDVTETIRNMYENVDAACDIPVYSYWEDILKAFPHAKVILMVRDNSDVWLKSLIRQASEMESKMLPFLFNLFSPTMRRFLNHTVISTRPTYGYRDFKLLNTFHRAPDILLKNSYEKHIAYVKQVCPPDQLLVFNCKDGWDPLCKFLQVSPPSTPFPHKNIKGKVFEEEEVMLSVTFKRIRKEITLRTTISFIGIIFGIWSFFRFRILRSY